MTGRRDLVTRAPPAKLVALAHPGGVFGRSASTLCACTLMMFAPKG
jgi:hypothetical protein